MSKIHTPECITSLKDNEIFVFGSNQRGIHGAGAARVAMEKFGAQLYIGEGRTGQCYAIPTKDRFLQTLPITEISFAIDRFLKYVAEHPELTFYVTKIGCGLAGIPIEVMAREFKLKIWPDNVILPKEFDKDYD